MVIGLYRRVDFQRLEDPGSVVLTVRGSARMLGVMTAVFRMGDRVRIVSNTEYRGRDGVITGIQHTSNDGMSGQVLPRYVVRLENGGHHFFGVSDLERVEIGHSKETVGTVKQKETSPRPTSDNDV